MVFKNQSQEEYDQMIMTTNLYDVDNDLIVMFWRLCARVSMFNYYLSD